MDRERVSEAAARLGLHHGRMVSASKGWFIHAFPERAVVFNAYLADEEGNDLWWGDLDLTADEPALLDLAATLGETLFVMAEGSFLSRRGAERPRVAEAVLVVRPDRTASQPDGAWLPFDRGADGRLEVPREWRRPPPGLEPDDDANNDGEQEREPTP